MKEFDPKEVQIVLFDKTTGQRSEPIRSSWLWSHDGEEVKFINEDKYEQTLPYKDFRFFAEDYNVFFLIK